MLQSSSISPRFSLPGYVALSLLVASVLVNRAPTFPKRLLLLFPTAVSTSAKLSPKNLTTSKNNKSPNFLRTQARHPLLAPQLLSKTHPSSIWTWFKPFVLLREVLYAIATRLASQRVREVHSSHERSHRDVFTSYGILCTNTVEYLLVLCPLDLKFCSSRPRCITTRTCNATM